MFCSPKSFAVGAERVRDLSPDATLGYQPRVGIGADGRARANAQLERFYGLPPGPFERYVPVGGATELLEHLNPYAEAGATVFNLFPAGEPELSVAEIAAVAEEMS